MEIAEEKQDKTKSVTKRGIIKKRNNNDTLEVVGTFEISDSKYILILNDGYKFNLECRSFQSAIPAVIKVDNKEKEEPGGKND